MSMITDSATNGMTSNEPTPNIACPCATTSEKDRDLTTVIAGDAVGNLAVEECERASKASADDHSLYVNKDQEAEWAREDAEEEALLYQITRKLCNDLWPAPDTLRWRLSNYIRRTPVGRAMIAAPKEPIINRIKGGDLNHIMSITVPGSYTASKHQDDLILRIPRWEPYRIDRDVGILEYARRHTDILLPTVIRSDFNSNNALGKPYAIQRRVPGADIDTIWDTLTFGQRCRIARQLGQVNRTLRGVKSPVAGLIEPRDDNTFSIVPFEIDYEQDESPKSEAEPQPRAPQSILDIYLTQYNRWFAVDNMVMDSVASWPALIDLVREMDQLGCFASIDISFCHVDLHQGNVMVSIDPVDSSANITAVLDWDEAVFAPQFVQCEPPSWMWIDEDEEPKDLQLDQVWPYEMAGAGTTPEDKEKAEIKRVFEESAGGDEYRKLAYNESFRLARALWRIARDGFHESHYVHVAERILREWPVLREKMSSEKADHTQQGTNK